MRLFFKKLWESLCPSDLGDVSTITDEFVVDTTAPVKKDELTFRVVAFGDTESYVLEYNTGRGWTTATTLFTFEASNIEDRLNFPVISRNFHEVVEIGKKYKENPDKFWEDRQRDIDLYTRRKEVKRQRREAIKNRVEYI